MKIGPILQQTVRHFFPDMNDWLDRLKDTRDQESIVYPRRFLGWYGIALFLLQLGSRRQLDFDLDAPQVLGNLNRLAGTALKTLPVHDTLDHFLGHSTPASVASRRTQMIRRLIRTKTLDAARLLGRFVVAVDGTGWLRFSERHCDRCLVRQHATYTSYQHQVLEAKLLGPDDMALSIATAFIENGDAPVDGTAETFKQDCELSAFLRLAKQLKADFPQTPLCLTGDALYACGRVLQVCKDQRWSYVLTFKEGHMPAVWREFRTLLEMVPENRREVVLTRGGQTVVQVYRWVRDLSYEDSDGRTWTFHAILCEETVDGQTTTFAWITNLPVTAANVADIATQGGRHRWRIENQGFNRQKNSGFHLEHPYSTDPDRAQSYYYLMQIAHILLLLLEKGRLLHRLAQELGKTVMELFGSLKNIARRLLESLRYHDWSAEAASAQEPAAASNTS